MKAFQLTSQRGPESLQLVEDLPKPSAGPGEVIVRVHATSLNYRDLMIASGQYGGPLPLPRIPLSDGAGEIVEVGSGVTAWKVGDRVAGTFFQDWKTGPIRAEAFGSALGGTASGMLAEYVALSADGVVAIPPHLSYEEAATLP
ncbi:MAG: alcohol dehydrogenase catalytic domain-containing protein, partial [Limisphaerales bacterium]